MTLLVLPHYVIKIGIPMSVFHGSHHTPPRSVTVSVRCDPARTAVGHGVLHAASTAVAGVGLVDGFGRYGASQKQWPFQLIYHLQLIYPLNMVIFHSFVYVYQINGHFRNLNWRYLPYVRSIF